MSNLMVFEVFACKILTLLLHWALILSLLVFCILRRSLKGREYPFKLVYRGVYDKPIVLLWSWVFLDFFFFWFVWWR